MARERILGLKAIAAHLGYTTHKMDRTKPILMDCGVMKRGGVEIEAHTPPIYWAWSDNLEKWRDGRGR